MSRVASPPAPPRSAPLLGLAAALTLIALTLYTFWPVQTHGLLNWDDGEVVGAALARPDGQSLATWAFTTRHMGHYQPLSWLALAALGGAADAAGTAARLHTASLWLHALNVVLLAWVTARLLDRGDGDDSRWLVVTAATALFAVHPLRVEPVAWASALPYLLSYAPLLGALACWIAWVRNGTPRAWWLALALFAASQLTRVTAPLLPLALVALAQVDARARQRPLAVLVRAALPFALVAVPLALAEASAREVMTLDEIGLAPRLTGALTQPALYLWRTLWPIGLSPLDPLPRTPVADWGLAAVVVLVSAFVVGLTWQLWSRRAAVAVWGSYLLLLLPVIGLLPSGLQATADRYTYGPAMVLTMALAAALVTVPDGLRRFAFVAAGGAALLLAQTTQAQTAYWHDSVALWSRALALDGNNDVALYNLALAEIAGGRQDLAIGHLQRLVALVPDHALAQQRLATLVADREQAAGDRAASAGDMRAAVAAYDRALGADPARQRTRLNRGMALMALNQIDRAGADLEAALGNDVTDIAAVNALAFAWASQARGGDAITLLRRARRQHPADQSLAANLARLLITVEPAALRAPEEALALAASLNDATGGEDPRVLDTLALALAATGRTADAREALGVAIDRAREAGNVDLAATLAARRAALGR